MVVSKKRKMAAKFGPVLGASTHKVRPDPYVFQILHHHSQWASGRVRIYRDHLDYTSSKRVRWAIKEYDEWGWV